MVSESSFGPPLIPPAPSINSRETNYSSSPPGSPTVRKTKSLSLNRHYSLDNLDFTSRSDRGSNSTLLEDPRVSLPPPSLTHTFRSPTIFLSFNRNRLTKTYRLRGARDRQPIREEGLRLSQCFLTAEVETSSMSRSCPTRTPLSRSVPWTAQYRKGS